MIRDDIKETKNKTDKKGRPEEEPFLAKEPVQHSDPLSVRKQEEVVWTEEIKDLKDGSSIERAGCCSRLFFSWARPFLAVSLI